MTVLILTILLLSLAISFGQIDVNNEGEGESRVSYLLEATGDGDLEGIERALENGEDINSINENGWTAASFAVAASNINVLRFLIEKGVDLNLANNDGYTPLMLAALQVCHCMIRSITLIFFFFFRVIKKWLKFCLNPMQIPQSLPMRITAPTQWLLNLGV
jgi:hypothetical protein